MSTQFLSIFLQGGPGGFGPMLMLPLMFVVMYFFMIRPQQKRAKEQKLFGESLGANDDIVTASGIHGRITRVNDDGTIQLEIARNTFITIERSAVSGEMTQAKRKRSEAAGMITSTAA